jgi:hypothetical protein
MLLNDDDTDANKNDGADNKGEDEVTGNNTTKRHEQSSTVAK